MKQLMQTASNRLPAMSRGGAARMASLCLVALTALLACAGCGKPGTAPVASNGDSSELAEVTKFRKAFQSADTRTKFSVDEMIQMIRGGTYGDALSNLQKFGGNPQLTPEQKQSIQDLCAKLQSQMAETVSK